MNDEFLFDDGEELPNMPMLQISSKQNSILLYGPKKLGFNINIDRDADIDPQSDALMLQAILTAYLPRETLEHLTGLLGRTYIKSYLEMAQNIQNEAERFTPSPKKKIVKPKDTNDA